MAEPRRPARAMRLDVMTLMLRLGLGSPTSRGESLLPSGRNRTRPACGAAVVRAARPRRQAEVGVPRDDRRHKDAARRPAPMSSATGPRGAS